MVVIGAGSLHLSFDYKTYADGPGLGHSVLIQSGWADAIYTELPANTKIMAARFKTTILFNV